MDSAASSVPPTDLAPPVVSASPEVPSPAAEPATALPPGAPVPPPAATDPAAQAASPFGNLADLPWGEWLNKVETEVRARPALWIGGAVVAGLALSRILNPPRPQVIAGSAAPGSDPLSDLLKSALESAGPDVKDRLKQFGAKTITDLLQKLPIPAQDSPDAAAPPAQS